VEKQSGWDREEKEDTGFAPKLPRNHAQHGTEALLQLRKLRRKEGEGEWEVSNRRQGISQKNAGNRYLRDLERKAARRPIYRGKKDKEGKELFRPKKKKLNREAVENKGAGLLAQGDALFFFSPGVKAGSKGFMPSLREGEEGSPKRSRRNQDSPRKRGNALRPRKGG